jgi:hypothetical protein
MILMFYLYGILHGGTINSLAGYRGNIKIAPSLDFIEDLLRIPKGTKVGLESMKESDWDEVKFHLITLPFNPPKSCEEDLRPYYTQSHPTYWDILAKVCLDFDLEVVFLEDKKIWFGYNKMIVKNQENELRRKNKLFHKNGESEEHYDRKRIGFNTEKFKEDIYARKMHEIDRDNSLLKRIKSEGVDVAVVGVGHSDYWMANHQAINQAFGVTFDGYSTELLRKKHFPGEEFNHFEKNAKPDLRCVFVRTSLERTLRLLENGSLGDGKPDFIGTWDIHTPLEGYFEMFMDRSGKNIHGKIIDCLGDADFEGEINKRGIQFVKTYNQDRCVEGVVNKILYKGIIRDDNVIGLFLADGFGNPFFATTKPTKDSIDLGLSWNSSAKRYKTGIKSLHSYLSDYYNRNQK